MKFSLLQENLHAALQDLQKGVPSRPQLPILSCVFVEASAEGLSLSVTDLQFGIRTFTAATVEQPGKAAIPAKIFMDLVGTFDPGTVTISLEEHTVLVQSQRSTVKIQSLPPDDFPTFPEKEGEEVSLPAKFFFSAVSSTAFAASLEESRPVLMSLLFNLGETLELVGTDGFRLANITLPYSAAPLRLLLPARAVSEVVRIATRKKSEDVVFTVSEKLKQTFFSFEGVDILVRIMDGEFPPYQKIIPVDFSTQLIFDAEEFSQKMKTANLFARESSGIIKLVIETDQMKILSSSSALGTQESSLPITLLQGGNQEIAFNGKYIQDFLSILKPEKVWMGMNESLKPAVFRPEGMDHYKYIVMPFRVSQ